MTNPRDDLADRIRDAVDDWRLQDGSSFSINGPTMFEAIADALLAAYPQLAATFGSVERQETYVNGTRTAIRRTVYATPWEDAP